VPITTRGAFTAKVECRIGLLSTNASNLSSKFVIVVVAGPGSRGTREEATDEPRGSDRAEQKGRKTRR